MYADDVYLLLLDLAPWKGMFISYSLVTLLFNAAPINEAHHDPICKVLWPLLGGLNYHLILLIVKAKHSGSFVYGVLVDKWIRAKMYLQKGSHKNLLESFTWGKLYLSILVTKPLK